MFSDRSQTLSKGKGSGPGPINTQDVLVVLSPDRLIIDSNSLFDDISGYKKNMSTDVSARSSPSFQPSPFGGLPAQQRHAQAERERERERGKGGGSHASATTRLDDVIPSSQVPHLIAMISLAKKTKGQVGSRCLYVCLCTCG